MNSNQRKFIKELATLMKKYNARFDTITSFGEYQANRFNIGGKSFDIYGGFSPSTLMNMYYNSRGKSND